MSCEHVRNLIHTLPRSAWSAAERKRIEEHASTCAECAQRLALEAHLEDSLASLGEPEPPPELADEVMARVIAHHVNHAKAPSPTRQFAGDLAKSAGIALGVCAYLLRLFQTGTVFETPRLGAFDLLIDGSLQDPLMLMFVASAIVYLVGLFAPLRSVEERKLERARAV